MKAKLLLGALLMLGSMSSYATTVMCHVGTDYKPYCKKGSAAGEPPAPQAGYTKLSDDTVSKIFLGQGTDKFFTISPTGEVKTFDFNFQSIPEYLPPFSSAPTKIVGSYDSSTYNVYYYYCISTSQELYCMGTDGEMFPQNTGGRIFKDIATAKRHIWAIDTNNVMWFKQNFQTGGNDNDWVQVPSTGLNDGPITSLSLDSRSMTVCGVSTGRQIYCKPYSSNSPWYSVSGGGSDEVVMLNETYWATASGNLWSKRNGQWNQESGKAAPYDASSLGKFSVGNDAVYPQGNAGCSPVAAP